jgi:hypothetical protein
MPARPFRLGRSKTGLGLFATKPIRRAVYIATYRGPRIPAAEADRREARGARYMFEFSKRLTIDGSPRWNTARYFNHSCKPNAQAILRKGQIVFVALRRIEPEEEITYDYGKEYLEYFIRNGGCRCAGCRKKRARRRAKRRAERKAELELLSRRRKRAWRAKRTRRSTLPGMSGKPARYRRRPSPS